MVKRRRTDNTMVKRKKDKRTSNILQYAMYTERVTWTPLKTGGELKCSRRGRSSCSKYILTTMLGQIYYMNQIFEYDIPEIFNCTWRWKYNYHITTTITDPQGFCLFKGCQNWIFLFILNVANIRCFILIKCSEQEARFKKICYNVVISEKN